MSKSDNDEPDLKIVVNLLILNLLKDGVDPKAISAVTGIAEKTIRNKFPMTLIRTNKKNG